MNAPGFSQFRNAYASPQPTATSAPLLKTDAPEFKLTADVPAFNSAIYTAVMAKVPVF